MGTGVDDPLLILLNLCTFKGVSDVAWYFSISRSHNYSISLSTSLGGKDSVLL